MAKTNTRRKSLLLFCAALVSSSFLFVSPIETIAGDYRYTPPKYKPAPKSKPNPASVYIPIEEPSPQTIFGYPVAEQFGRPYILEVDNQYWVCSNKAVPKEMSDMGITLVCIAPNPLQQKVKVAFLPRKGLLINKKWASVGIEGKLNCKNKEIKPGPLLFSTEPFLKNVTQKHDTSDSNQWGYGLEGTPIGFAILFSCLE